MAHVGLKANCRIWAHYSGSRDRLGSQPRVYSKVLVESINNMKHI